LLAPAVAVAARAREIELLRINFSRGAWHFVDFADPPTADRLQAIGNSTGACTKGKRE